MIEISRAHDFPLKIKLETFKQSNLEGVDFHRCYLNNMDFDYSAIIGTDFRSAEMRNSNFFSSNLFKCKIIMVEAQNSIFDKSGRKRFYLTVEIAIKWQ